MQKKNREQANGEIMCRRSGANGTLAFMNDAGMDASRACCACGGGRCPPLPVSSCVPPAPIHAWPATLLKAGTAVVFASIPPDVSEVHLGG